MTGIMPAENGANTKNGEGGKKKERKTFIQMASGACATDSQGRKVGCRPNGNQFSKMRAPKVKRDRERQKKLIGM